MPTMKLELRRKRFLRGELKIRQARQQLLEHDLGGSSLLGSRPQYSAKGLERAWEGTITPHDAGYSPLSDTRLGELFLDDLGRYARGEPLRNEVRVTGLSAKG
jgi:hypothetical protein